LPPLIIIGASTGGPKALASILSEFPDNFLATIVIIQHVDVQFSPGLAKWLNEQTSLSVALASQGSILETGKVLLAGTNDHLVLRSNLTLTYTKEPLNYPYRPSIDVFCESVAQHWSRKGIAVLLTGMGRDGAMGLQRLRHRGWHTIAQNQQSCVVYGMPKAAVEIGAAVEVLSLSDIASTLIKRVTLIT
jgi:two-component system response regulator WspF